MEIENLPKSSHTKTNKLNVTENQAISFNHNNLLQTLSGFKNLHTLKRGKKRDTLVECALCQCRQVRQKQAFAGNTESDETHLI